MLWRRRAHTLGETPLDLSPSLLTFQLQASGSLSVKGMSYAKALWAWHTVGAHGKWIPSPVDEVASCKNEILSWRVFYNL